MISSVFYAGFTWYDTDFADLGWSGCRLYSISLPGLDEPMVIDSDYILAGLLHENDEQKFHIVPVNIIFCDVTKLKISLDIGRSSSIDIVSIERFNRRITPNGHLHYWDFRIETEGGIIEFTGTSFNQVCICNSKMSDVRELGRELRRQFTK